MASKPEGAKNGVRLVVGASRGIGLALVEKQLADPAVCRVIATLRPTSDPRGLERLAKLHGERLHRVELDITDCQIQLSVHLPTEQKVIQWAKIPIKLHG